MGTACGDGRDGGNRVWGRNQGTYVVRPSLVDVRYEDGKRVPSEKLDQPVCLLDMEVAECQGMVASKCIFNSFYQGLSASSRVFLRGFSSFYYHG